MSNPSWRKRFESAVSNGNANEAWPAGAVAERLLGAFFLSLIAIYKRFISPLLGPHCRFHPTCSSYAAEAIRRYGPFRGALRASARILRCQPLCSGGYDPVL